MKSSKRSAISWLVIFSMYMLVLTAHWLAPVPLVRAMGGSDQLAFEAGYYRNLPSLSLTDTLSQPPLHILLRQSTDSAVLPDVSQSREFDVDQFLGAINARRNDATPNAANIQN